MQKAKINVTSQYQPTSRRSVSPVAQPQKSTDFISQIQSLK